MLQHVEKPQNAVKLAFLRELTAELLSWSAAGQEDEITMVTRPG